MLHDYTNITEQPDALVNSEQWARLHHRYGLALRYATKRRVLEAACGSGLGLPALRSVADSVAAFDYTQSMPDVAHSHQPAATLVRSDAQQLPFASHSVDLVLCFEAIYYLPHPAAFLAECRRVLAAGGELLVGTSNPNWSAFVPGALTQHYPDAAELSTLLVDAGFRHVELCGAFADEERSRRQQTLAVLRRFVLHRTPLSNLLRRQPRLAALLQRASYGPLRPLPPAVDADVARTILEEIPLAPLRPNQADRRHRVLYAIARG